MKKVAHKILVVEDESMLREVYTLVLTRNGFDVQTAVNGEEGLKVLDTFNPDVVLLDLLMPQMDGKTFLKSWHSDSHRHNTKIIVYSNLFDSDTTDHVMKLGAYSVVLKSSLSPSQLVNLIKDAIADI